MELRLWILAALSLVGTARSESDLVARANDACPSTGFYTAPIGLVYDLFCKQDLTARGIGSVPAASLQECMDICSEAQTELCYGVTYDPGAQKCNLKSNQATRQSIVGGSSFHSAIARIQVKNNTCQFPNATIHASTNGLNFDVRCQTDMTVKDYCPQNAPYQPKGSAGALGLCPYHAETLQDCMDSCSKAQPLCKAVSFSQTMTHGFGNCYPKSDVDNTTINNLQAGPDVSHMAFAKLPILDLGCSVGGNAIASDGRNFTIHCDRDSPGSDLNVTHKENLQDCVEACASIRNTSTTTGCVGVSYDPGMGSGYLNCYLKSFMTRPLKQIRSHQVAVLPNGLTAASSLPNATSSATPAPKSGGGVQPWIAGPIVGGIAVLLLLLGALVWCCMRRRKQRRQSRHPVELGGGEIYRDGEKTYDEKKVGTHPIFRRTPKRDSKKYELPSQETEIHEIGTSTPGLHELPGGVKH